MRSDRVLLSVTGFTTNTRPTTTELVPRSRSRQRARAKASKSVPLARPAELFYSHGARPHHGRLSGGM